MDGGLMTAAGRAWMAGELSSAEYFAMARRETRPERGLWRRLRAVWGEQRG